MHMKKKIVVIVGALLAFAAIAMLVKSNTETAKVRCTSKEACLNNPNCQCYCSVKCGPRDKKPTDTPTWIKNDPLGHHCYCAERDLRLKKNCKAEQGVLDNE